MANNVFSKVDTFLNDFLTSISQNVQTLLANDIGTLLYASISLYVVIYGYMVLTGKVQTPLADILWNLARFAIIIAFIKNEGGILGQFNEAVKGLSEIGGDGKTTLQLFDDLLTETSQFAEATSENATTGTGWAVSILIWLGFGLMSIPIALTFLLSKISLYFLLSLSPIFFFMLMWGWLKDSFAQFASALLANALALVCINIMVKSSTNFLQAQMTLSGNVWLVSFSFIVLGAMAGMAIKYMVNVINTIMKVSVERAGAGVVGAYKGARNTAQAPFTPTSNDIARSQVQASQSQVATQKALQDLAKNINK